MVFSPVLSLLFLKEIKVGNWYNFQGELESDLWPARVYAIFWEKTRRQDATLSIQWLYRKEQCVGIANRDTLYSDPQERIFSHHFDEVHVSSCVSKCTVRFLPKQPGNYDYCARLFFDHVSKEIRPLTRKDIEWRPSSSAEEKSKLEKKKRSRKESLQSQQTRSKTQRLYEEGICNLSICIFAQLKKKNKKKKNSHEVFQRCCFERDCVSMLVVDWSISSCPIAAARNDFFPWRRFSGYDADVGVFLASRGESLARALAIHSGEIICCFRSPVVGCSDASKVFAWLCVHRAFACLLLVQRVAAILVHRLFTCSANHRKRQVDSSHRICLDHFGNVALCRSRHTRGSLRIRSESCHCSTGTSETSLNCHAFRLALGPRSGLSFFLSLWYFRSHDNPLERERIFAIESLQRSGVWIVTQLFWWAMSLTLQCTIGPMP